MNVLVYLRKKPVRIARKSRGKNQTLPPEWIKALLDCAPCAASGLDFGQAQPKFGSDIACHALTCSENSL